MMSSTRSLLLGGACLAIGAVAALTVMTSEARSASLIWDPVVDTCTAQNCGAVFLNGISQKNAFGDSVPFTLQVFADVNECLRLEVTGQSADTEIVLTSPSGSVWRNDDGAGNFRPLVIARGDVKGYYSVQINYYSGNQAINTLQLFTLAYGRYNVGNPTNCPAPSPPTLASAHAAKVNAGH